MLNEKISTKKILLKNHYTLDYAGSRFAPGSTVELPLAIALDICQRGHATPMDIRGAKCASTLDGSTPGPGTIST